MKARKIILISVLASIIIYTTIKGLFYGGYSRLDHFLNVIVFVFFIFKDSIFKLLKIA
jgi:hypothetical protein